MHTKENDFLWFSEWYRNHCFGNLKNERRLSLGTLDNPGWSLKINLEDTELKGKKFQSIKVDRTEDNWICCFLKNNKFIGVGGPLNLSEIFYIFINWAELYQNEKKSDSKTNFKMIQKNDESTFLQKWFLNQCDQDWEHMFGIHIETLEKINDIGWHVNISLNETIYENVPFIGINEFKGKNDWYKYEIIENEFIASCDPLKLNLREKMIGISMRLLKMNLLQAAIL